MTRRVDANEFALVRRAWLGTYVPASLKELATWRKDLSSALAILRYMEVVRVTIEGPPDLQIEVRAKIVGQNLPFEPIQADLERVWRDNLSEGLDAIHLIALSESLSLSFVATTADKSVVTGRIVVART